MAQRYDSAFPSAARTQTPIEGSQHRVLFIGGGPGTLRQNTAKPVAAVRPAGLADTGAFVIAGAQARLPETSWKVSDSRPLIDYATAAPFAIGFLETALAIEDSSNGIWR